MAIERVNKIVWKTPDGREFNTEEAAEKHEMQNELLKLFGVNLPRFPGRWEDRDYGFVQCIEQMVDKRREVMRILSKMDY